LPLLASLNLISRCRECITFEARGSSLPHLAPIITISSTVVLVEPGMTLLLLLLPMLVLLLLVLSWRPRPFDPFTTVTPNAAVLALAREAGPVATSNPSNSKTMVMTIMPQHRVLYKAAMHACATFCLVMVGPVRTSSYHAGIVVGPSIDMKQPDEIKHQLPPKQVSYQSMGSFSSYSERQCVYGVI
jgi:hypothetical protein